MLHLISVSPELTVSGIPHYLLLWSRRYENLCRSILFKLRQLATSGIDEGVIDSERYFNRITSVTMHLYPPQNFGAVEEGIYRSGLPSELNYRFLESLNLRTVIILSPESMDNQFASFLEDFGIGVVYIQNVSNDGFRGLSPVAEETVIDALHLLTNRINLVSARRDVV